VQPLDCFPAKVYNRVHKSSPFVLPILSQTNPVHRLVVPSFVKIGRALLRECAGRTVMPA
jgi:hypothetical protein